MAKIVLKQNRKTLLLGTIKTARFAHDGFIFYIFIGTIVDALN